MRNPCTRSTRRSLLIGFFLVQFVLFSIYSFIHYQNDDEITDENEHFIAAAPPNDLPASRLEHGPRSYLIETYANVKAYLKDQKQDTRSYEKLKSLNVSFVTESDQQSTIVQCPILPPNLGN